MGIELGAGFAAVMFLITVAYAAITFYASTRWTAHAPTTATLAEAETELKLRARRQQRDGRSSSRDGVVSDETVDEWNAAARQRAHRETALPLRIARTHLLSHAPILPSTRKLEESLLFAGSDGNSRVAAQSTCDLSASQVIASGVCRELAPRVALALYGQPAPHNRWREGRAAVADATGSPPKLLDNAETQAPLAASSTGARWLTMEDLQRPVAVYDGRVAGFVDRCSPQLRLEPFSTLFARVIGADSAAPYVPDAGSDADGTTTPSPLLPCSAALAPSPSGARAPVRSRFDEDIVDL